MRVNNVLNLFAISLISVISFWPSLKIGWKLFWIHVLCSIKILTTFVAVDVHVVCFLLHEIFTTDIYHQCFTSASDDNHTIIHYMDDILDKCPIAENHFTSCLLHMI